MQKNSPQNLSQNAVGIAAHVQPPNCKCGRGDCHGNTLRSSGHLVQSIRQQLFDCEDDLSRRELVATWMTCEWRPKKKNPEEVIFHCAYKCQPIAHGMSYPLCSGVFRSVVSGFVSPAQIRRMYEKKRQNKSATRDLRGGAHNQLDAAIFKEVLRFVDKQERVERHYTLVEGRNLEKVVLAPHCSRAWLYANFSNLNNQMCSRLADFNIVSPIIR